MPIASFTVREKLLLSFLRRFPMSTWRVPDLLSTASTTSFNEGRGFDPHRAHQINQIVT